MEGFIIIETSIKFSFNTNEMDSEDFLNIMEQMNWADCKIKTDEKGLCLEFPIDYPFKEDGTVNETIIKQEHLKDLLPCIV
ncbi:hypothetical protein [Methanobrevibacter arboriphilus]|uniref:Uncharacterized protein n=1 Tax=Methanobrevibacter arboriphilus TaxID=39441 RepID=A0ACA8R523_METAZ|nr:hypothetical protein [Methanobrevibacter arboriphilus]BBL62395.1 hypothetical protein MarbSA_14350 [Methanobrevibacter arboriphilus]